eukprot:TRINITY_DN35749_c0_g1_i1.p1 TRINITY_DN35749_c0_g1~~TRINITY_DN35749_c0_g1_i1.p1  ORF type:complete len:459 (+),score=6.46 TRINITY_DN35749_c0_g1_i1:86-1378(+)
MRRACNSTSFRMLGTARRAAGNFPPPRNTINSPPSGASQYEAGQWQGSPRDEAKWREAYAGHTLMSGDRTVAEEQARQESRNYLDESAGGSDSVYHANRQRQRRMLRDKDRRWRERAEKGDLPEDVARFRAEKRRWDSDPIITRGKVERISGVDLSLPACEALFEQLEGKDVTFSQQMIVLQDPPCIVCPSTNGKFRTDVRKALQATEFSNPANVDEWFGSNGKPIVCLMENRGVWAARVARALPSANVLVLAEQEAQLFKAVSAANADGPLPPNMRFLRGQAAFWFSLQFMPDESLDELILDHPTVYASMERSNKRNPTRDFLCMAHPKLKVGGRVKVSTLCEPFHEWCVSQFLTCKASWVRDSKPASPWSPLMERLQDDELPMPENESQLFSQEWVKPSSTPEIVHDWNRHFTYHRRHQEELPWDGRR